MVDTAFVLAGGLGTRLRSVVPELPKPMATVAGRPFLEHLFDYFVSQKVRKIVVCVGYRAQTIRDYFGDEYGNCAIRYSQETEPLGTGGALSQALKAFPPNSPFLVANGDTYFPVDTDSLVEALGANSWALAVFRTTDSKRYGALEIGPNGEVLDFISDWVIPEGDAGPEFSANSGIWIGNPADINLPFFDGGQQFSLEEYLSSALKTERATATSKQFESSFIDIGVPSDFAKAQTMPELFGA